jgi:hypothetical protein
MDPDEIPAFRKSLRNFNVIDRRRWRAYRALVRDLSIASNFGSDSLSMKFAGGVVVISVENQRHASTSAALLTGAQRLRRRGGGP